MDATAVYKNANCDGMKGFIEVKISGSDLQESTERDERQCACPAMGQ